VASGAGWAAAGTGWAAAGAGWAASGAGWAAAAGAGRESWENGGNEGGVGVWGCPQAGYSVSRGRESLDEERSSI
jgi:hypothetical protein